MERINVVVIHGIGVTGRDYAKRLKKGVTKEFNSSLKHLLGGKAGSGKNVVCKAIVWDDILAENQRKLKVIFREALSHMKADIIKGVFSLGSVLGAALLFYFLRNPAVFWLFLVPLACVATWLVFKLRTGFAAEFVSDIIGYRNEGAKDAITRRILQETGALKGKQRANITFISHSLGTVIASDFIYDQGKKPRGSFARGFYLSNFFTMGSPLPLFSLQYGPDMFQSPIYPEDKFGRWVNIFDKDDPIAYPLKPLNRAYDRAVHKDKEINTGIFGLAHIAYWKNKSAHKIIGRKLAIDWCRLNNKLSKEQLKKLYAGYDKNVGLCRS